MKHNVERNESTSSNKPFTTCDHERMWIETGNTTNHNHDD
jgi:hypothetical protein